MKINATNLIRQALTSGRYLNNYEDIGGPESGPSVCGGAWLTLGRVEIHFEVQYPLITFNGYRITQSPKLMKAYARKHPMGMFDELPGVLAVELDQPIVTEVHIDELKGKSRNICNSDKRCASSEEHLL